MYNCYRVYWSGNLYVIFHSEVHAQLWVDMIINRYPYVSREEFRIEPAFIENIGF